MSDRPVAMTLCVTAHRTPYLTECLLSVLAQSTRDFNLVLCADSSGDRTVRTVYEQFAPFLTVNCLEIVEVRGGTAGIVRNAAFDRARTPWVTYLDGDDILLPSAMSDLLAEIESDEVDIASTGIFRIHEDGRIEDIPRSLRYKPPIWIYHVDPRTFRHWAFFNQFLAIRRDLWDRYRFTEEATNREDVDFMLHQLLMGRYAKIPEAVYGYRRTHGGFSERIYSGGDICSRRYEQGYY